MYKLNFSCGANGVGADECGANGVGANGHGSNEDGANDVKQIS